MNGVQLSVPCILSVSWDPPNNSKKFDLDHFKVHVMLLEQESYIANGTSMEPEYHFHSDNVMVPPQSSTRVIVTAVSKCSLSGPLLYLEINHDEAVFTNVHDHVVSKTESDLRPEEYRHNLITMNGNITLQAKLML